MPQEPTPASNANAYATGAADPQLTLTSAEFTAPSSLGSSASSSIDNGRFAPGAILLQRYRVVELLGRGGMGEVYRADDLKLSQPIAMKFLTARLAADAAGLSTLYNEARSARLVGHPNVCRVFDVGEVDGLPFISMEYVDGENLKSLGARFGRLPHDKSVELAQQLCSGLHAIHEQGLLHRDLKPTNVMIDGRGRVRITDFGLAGSAAELSGPGARAGTPAYMAPEQITGRGLSVRSDVYALGLVLYEMFTGRRAFEGETWADFSRLHSEHTPRTPTSVVPDLHPAIERVILRCLEKDPVRRPASALAVLAGLPGGDPLAAALAAGETPSPDLVAAARTQSGAPPALVLGCLAFVLAAVASIAVLNDLYSPLRYAQLDQPPVVLDARVQELLRAFGYSDPARDAKAAFGWNQAAVKHARREDSRPDFWTRIADHPGAIVRYYHRAWDRPMVAVNSSGAITWDDPPPTEPGMRGAVVDPTGRLQRFYAVPPDFDSAREAESGSDLAPRPAWSAIFRAVRLDEDDFEETPPTWTPHVYCDQRRAWRQTGADPNKAVRIEAGAYGGKINFVNVTGPWSQPRADGLQGPGAFEIAVAVVVLSILAAGFLLAMRNIRLGRGDGRGALSVSIALFALTMLGWMFTTDMPPSIANVVPGVIKALGPPTFYAGMFWLIYMALEPIVRRRWPHRLVSWTRVVAGQWRDPIVGRDVLLGLTVGCLVALSSTLVQAAPEWMGHSSDRTTMLRGVNFLSASSVLAQLAGAPVVAVFNGLVFLFVPLLFYIGLQFIAAPLRQSASVGAARWMEGAAGGLSFVFWALLFLSTEEHNSGSTLGVAHTVCVALVYSAVALYLGLLTSTVVFMTVFLLSVVPITADFSLWYAPTVSLAAAAVVLLAILAFATALGNRPLLRANFLDA